MPCERRGAAAVLAALRDAAAAVPLTDGIFLAQPVEEGATATDTAARLRIVSRHALGAMGAGELEAAAGAQTPFSHRDSFWVDYLWTVPSMCKYRLLVAVLCSAWVLRHRMCLRIDHQWVGRALLVGWRRRSSDG